MKAAWVAGAAIVAAAAVAGGGWWWAIAHGQSELRTAASEIRQSLGPGGSFVYDGSAVHPFSGSADLSHVVMRLASGALLTADRVSVRPGGSPGKLAWLRGSGLKITGGTGPSVLTASTLNVSDAVLPPTIPGQTFDLATALIGHAALAHVAVQGGGAEATADTIAMANYGAGRSTSVEVRSLVLPVPNAGRIDRLTFDEGRVSGIDVATAVNAMERGQHAPAAIEPVAVDVDGLAATSRGAPILSITRMTMTGSPGANGSSSTARLKVDRFIVRPTDQKSEAAFQVMGLDELGGSLQADGAYTFAGGVFTNRETLSLDRLGALGFTIVLAHLDVAPFEKSHPNAADLLGVLANAELVSATARITDAGMLDRVLGMVAARSGLPPASLRAAIVTRIGQDPVIAQLPQGSQFGAALATFVQHGGVLTVAVRPSHPEALLQLLQAAQADPASLATQLDLSASADGSIGISSSPAPM